MILLIPLFVLTEEEEESASLIAVRVIKLIDDIIDLSLVHRIISAGLGRGVPVFLTPSRKNHFVLAILLN